jgi:exonuclease VII large subunit
MSILLDNERKAKDDANQQLTEAKKKIDTDCKIKDDLHQRLSEATTLLDAERRAKDDLARRLSEATTLLDCERKKAKDDLEKCMSEAAILLDNEHKSKDDANQRLAEIKAKLDDVLEREIEQNIKRSEKLHQRPESLESLHNPHAKKRKTTSSKNTENSEISVHTQIKRFVDTCIVLSTGSFLPTQAIQEVFFAGSITVTQSNISHCFFQKTFKSYTLDVFSSNPEVIYNRSMSNGERSWGYSGLALK